MTEKKFRFLEQLEDDLRDAAARERVANESKRPRKGPRSTSESGHDWTRWTAAAVVVLVVAGGIGAYAQHNDRSYNTVGAVAGSGTVHNAAGGGSTPQGSASWGVAGSTTQEENQLGIAKDASGRAGTSAVPAPSGELAAYNAGSVSRTIAGTAPTTQPDLSKIVRNGVMTVQLPAGKFPGARDLVTQYAAAAGGYVLSSSARGDNAGTFVLRIPAKRLDAVMQKFADLPDGKVLWQNSTSQDVTSEFVDSGAQLQILKAQKTATLRYLRNATSLSQTIQFRNQAFQIQGDIDKLQGRLNYLSNQVSLATLTVNLRETGAPTHKPAPVTKPSLVRAWDRSVSGFLGVVSAVIVGLGFLVPLAIIALVLGFPIMVAVRKRRAANSAS